MENVLSREYIFNEEEDYQKFKEILMECKAISGYELYAYCLMHNHVHLLMKENQEDLSQVFKRIGVRYVYWYNWKYDRKGHLFQDRFKSQPVEDDKYLLAVLRYIHQNPTEAKIVKQIEEYPYSSYQEYIGEKQDVLIDKALVLGIMNLEEFVQYHQTNSEEKIMKYAEENRTTEAEAKTMIKKISGCGNAEEFLELEEKKREECIQNFKEIGISIRQISRLTGVSIGIVRRIK